MGKKIIASIEARMTSKRLPGKVLLPCVGKPMLELLVERVKRSKLVQDIVVATTINSPDDAIVQSAKKLGIRYFRGSEDDVLGRVVGAMECVHADVIVQLTADCPLLDSLVIDQLVRLYLFNSYDYVSNTRIRSYPAGLDVQVVSLSVLKKSLALAKDDAQHEHVCLSIYENPDKFKIFNLLASPELSRPDLRWVLDTQEDYEFIRNIYQYFYKKNASFSTLEIIHYLDNHPEIVAINSYVRPKPVR